ncbi:methyl-accepting chemotaxis protein [Heliorestis convoluta]|uniref:Methyl-accepting chemotaxis protein n=2 Tax=Heliorestis convoluta TaxID=356322 RepID=A0A5Q2N8L0_9FIRM|nr:methyl-accepting chemotaxis protein [Heliorestis convoluta]
MQTARSSGELGDRANRWWFKKIMDGPDKPFVSKSYYSISGNMAVSSVIMPIYRDNELVGIFGSDLKLESLQELVDRTIEGQERYAYIIDGEGYVVAQEIKKLAEQTSEATKEITDLIVATQTNVKKVVSMISESSQQMEQGFHFCFNHDIREGNCVFKQA